MTGRALLDTDRAVHSRPRRIWSSTAAPPGPAPEIGGSPVATPSRAGRRPEEGSMHIPIEPTRGFAAGVLLLSWLLGSLAVSELFVPRRRREPRG